MHRFYKYPILLIEFDESVPFEFGENTDYLAGSEPSILSIYSKLSMLTFSFQNLQILWSTGPEHSAELLYHLKQTFSP